MNITTQIDRILQLDREVTHRTVIAPGEYCKVVEDSRDIARAILIHNVTTLIETAEWAASRYHETSFSDPPNEYCNDCNADWDGEHKKWCLAGALLTALTAFEDD